MGLTEVAMGGKKWLRGILLGFLDFEVVFGEGLKISLRDFGGLGLLWFGQGSEEEEDGGSYGEVYGGHNNTFECLLEAG